MYSPGSSHSKGVMILFNPKLYCKIKKIAQDKNGRFVFAKLTTDDSHFILVNIYSPNDINQQLLFFQELQTLLQQYPHDNIIIGGDFNCALTQGDKEDGNPVTKKSLVINELNKLCDLYNLCDIWRSLNSDAKHGETSSSKCNVGKTTFSSLANLVSSLQTVALLTLQIPTTLPCN